MRIGPYIIAAVVIVAGLALLVVKRPRSSPDTGLSRLHRQRAQEQRIIQQYTGQQYTGKVAPPLSSFVPPPPMPRPAPAPPRLMPPPPGVRVPPARGALSVRPIEWSKERVEQVLAAAEAAVAAGEGAIETPVEAAAPADDGNEETPDDASASKKLSKKLSALDPRSVRAALASTADAVRDCYVVWAGGEPAPDDRIVAQFTIRDDDGDGVANPSGVRIIEASPSNTATTACIGAAVSGLEFEVPPQGSVRVTLPVEPGPPRPSAE